MYACMYVCMYVCMYIYIYIYIYIYRGGANRRVWLPPFRLVQLGMLVADARCGQPLGLVDGVA